MLVLGDFAYPDPFLNVESTIFDGEVVLVNCEGYILESASSSALPQTGVYNNPTALQALRSRTLVLGLANNHVMDACSGAVDSIAIAKKFGFFTVGAGGAFQESVAPLILNEGGVEIAIIAAGWDAIGCVHATGTSQGCAPLLDSVLLPIIRKQKALGRKVVVFAHWGYELEIYPHPTHRNCAIKWIDNGADIVVGCHAHCLQGYETHKEKHIFYGIGNAVFKQKHYFSGRVSFPSWCNSGLVIQWSPETNSVRVADISLRGSAVVTSDFVDPLNHKTLAELSTFSGCSPERYLVHFSERRRKRRLLPVFKEDDVSIGYKIKIAFLRARARVISTLLKAGLKGPSR